MERTIPPAQHTRLPARLPHPGIVPTVTARPTRAAACFVTSLAGALATCLTCHAEWDSERYLVHNLGPISLRPRLDLAETYDSNLFYSDTNRVDDLITAVHPGVTILAGDRETSFLSLTYSLNANFHASERNLDDVGHGIFSESQVRLRRLHIQGVDSFSIARSTLGGSFSYVQRPVEVVYLSDVWRADYDISPKTLVGGGLQFDYYDYEAKDLGTYNLYDYMSLQGNVRVGYLVAEKLVLFPQFTLGESWLSKNLKGSGDAPELTSYGFNFGAEGEFTPKLSGRVTGGYEFRQYSDSSDVPDGWVASLDLKWEPRPKTTVNLGFRHWIQATRDSSGVAYTADRPQFSLTQQLGTQGRWSIIVDGYYQLDEYSRPYSVGGKTRADDLAGVGVRSTFRWTPWLTAVASYEFSTYTDNVSTSPDYDVHRISLRFSAGY